MKQFTRAREAVLQLHQNSFLYASIARFPNDL